MEKSQLVLLLIPVVLFSLTVHEYSHGRVALILGDDTAKRLGRLTLNPIKHIDPLGALFFYFVGFGWAKPVPVDWRNFKNPQKDMMYVSLAGPVSNIILASVCSFFVRIVSPYEYPMLFYTLCFGVFVNVLLCVFNMLPLYPLDGSSVLKGLVSREAAFRLSQFDRYGAFVLLGILLMDRFAHTRIFEFLLLPAFLLIELMTQEVYPLLMRVLGATLAG